MKSPLVARCLRGQQVQVSPFLLTLLGLFAVLPTTHGAELFIDPMFGVQKTSNVLYGSNVDGAGNPVSLLLDVYEPTGVGLPDELPAIVLMHGGFFRSGSKSSSTMQQYANAFASRGYVAASIDYRLLGNLPPAPGAALDPPDNRLPSWLPGFLISEGVTLEQYLDTIAAAVEDQATAVEWLAANADTYNIDPDMIAVGGFSAGAVSSLALAADAVDGVDADIRVAFSMAGGLFGLEDAFDANDPGVYILHGVQDDVIPFSEVGFLTNAMDAVGVPYEETIVSVLGHDSALAFAVIDNPDFYRFMYTQVSIPEVSPAWLVAMGIAGATLRRRRRKAWR